MVLYCTRCGRGVTMKGEIPPSCPTCIERGQPSATIWISEAIPPRRPKLTDEDRAFLSSIHIATT